MIKIRNKPLILAISSFFLIAIFTVILYQIGKGPTAQTSLSPSSKEGKAISYLRIICATPSITEIVFALGCGDRIVGVSDFSLYPPEAAQIPKIGGLFNPNTERILSLKPDLIIFQGKHEKLARFCQKKKIRALSVKIDKLQDITNVIQHIGKELDTEVQASGLAEKILSELASIKQRTGKLKPKKVFLTLSHTPGDMTGIMTSGPGTFLHEAVELAGGLNIFSDATLLYPQISKEALIMRQPEVIIEVFAEGISMENRILLRNDWMRIASLQAVREGSIHFLTDDYLLIPGVRVAQTVKKLARIIHPEVFHE